MPDEPQSRLFTDPDKLVSDLNTFSRFPAEGKLNELATLRIAETLQLKEIGIGQDGKPRKPRHREIMAAVRAQQVSARINQHERDVIAGLLGAGERAQTAIQINIDTAKASQEDEERNDFIARIAAESAAILAAPDGDAGEQQQIDNEVQGDDPGGPNEPPRLHDDDKA